MTSITEAVRRQPVRTLLVAAAVALAACALLAIALATCTLLVHTDGPAGPIQGFLEGLTYEPGVRMCLKQPNVEKRHSDFYFGDRTDYRGCALFDGPCCHDGVRWNTECFDVEACAQAGPQKGKYAFVLTMTNQLKSLNTIRYLRNYWQHIRALRAAGNEADLVLLALPRDLDSMTAPVREILAKYEVVLQPVPWLMPPDLDVTTSHLADANRTNGAVLWCGPQDFIRIHVLGLSHYDAVIYIDLDIQIQNDPLPMFRCAARGYFLSAAGPMVWEEHRRKQQEPLNLGMFALRPDERLVKAATLFAKNVSFDWNTGWAEQGWAPAETPWWGADCGQGYFHALFHQNWSQHTRRVFSEAGYRAGRGPPMLKGVTVDPCIWNYIESPSCPRNYDCEKIVFHHKPSRFQPLIIQDEAQKSWLQSVLWGSRKILRMSRRQSRGQGKVWSEEDQVWRKTLHGSS